MFSSISGGMAEEIRDAGIMITDDLGRLREAPDVIHGHHFAPTLIAIKRWPTVPAIHVCHDHTSPYDRTPIHPNIRRHFGVSRVCVERLLRDGVPQARAGMLLNFVDIDRFAPRGPLPERPHRALVFSNYAHEGSHLPAVVEACRQAGIELDVVGAGMGRIVTSPELLLPGYDMVFAKAKAAMEAMAVGTAVILCDFSGVGPMVTSSAFEQLRPLNFGFETLRDPLQVKPLLREIAHYDPDDASRVRDMVRSRAGLVLAVEGLVAIYDDVISEHHGEPTRSRSERWDPWTVRQALFLRLYWRWISVPPRRREKLKKLPGAQITKRGLRRLLGQTTSSAR